MSFQWSLAEGYERGRERQAMLLTECMQVLLERQALTARQQEPADEIARIRFFRRYQVRGLLHRYLPRLAARIFL